MEKNNYEGHDEIFVDDSYLKIIAMPYQLLANKKLDATEKMIMAMMPNGERVKRQWKDDDENIIRIPYPSSIFKKLKLEQCYIFGFVSHMYLRNEGIEYKTTLKQLSNDVGMKTTETYKHLSVLVKEGFILKKLQNKELILTIDIPQGYDKMAQNYKGAKTVFMREEDVLKLFEES